MKSEYLDQYGIDSLPQLLLASRGGAHFFVTTNQGLIDDREELQEKFGIKIVSPDEMMKQ